MQRHTQLHIRRPQPPGSTSMPPPEKNQRSASLCCPAPSSAQSHGVAPVPMQRASPVPIHRPLERSVVPQQIPEHVYDRRYGSRPLQVAVLHGPAASAEHVAYVRSPVVSAPIHLALAPRSGSAKLLSISSSSPAAGTRAHLHLHLCADGQHRAAIEIRR